MRECLAGILAALALTTRYSEAIFLVPLLVIATRQQRRALLAGFALGAIVFLGVFDWITWGSPFASVVKFAELVVVRRDASSRIVNQPVWWYVTNLPHWLAVSALPLVVIGARAAPRRSLAFVVFPMIALSVVFHKELRYLQVVIPFALLIAAYGFTQWKRRTLATTLLLLSFPLGLTRIGSVERRSTNAVSAARWLAAQHPRAVMLPQAWAYGGRIFFGNQPRINDPGSPPSASQLREIRPTVDCGAMYTSDVGGVDLFPRRVEFSGRGGRAVTAFCR